MEGSVAESGLWRLTCFCYLHRENVLKVSHPPGLVLCYVIVHSKAYSYLMDLLQSQPKEPAPVDTPVEESKEPVADSDSEPYPEDDDIPEEDEEDVDEDDYPEEDLDKVRSVSNIYCICTQFGEWIGVWFCDFAFVKFLLVAFDFAQAPSSIKTPEKIEEEDTMPPYEAETQALIDCQ